MILEMKGISKSFYGVKALQDVTFGLKKAKFMRWSGKRGGQVDANESARRHPRAGGRRDRVRGKNVRIGSPQQARKLGISVIHQELQLVPGMTVAENVFLGREPKRAGLFSDRGSMAKETRKLLEPFGLDLNPHEKVANLSIGERQIVRKSRKRSR